MAKSSFRIIAVRPITPIRRDDETIARVKSIQKKAFGNDWMYFYGGYHLTDIPKAVADEYDLQPLYGHFLEVPEEVDNDRMLFDSDSISVNISAVVGPNGSGKSSTIELMIRILNNLSVAAKGETYNHKSSEHLFFIEDVYGCIVAVENELYFQIQVFGRSVKVASYQWDKESNCLVCSQLQELLDTEGQVNRFVPINGSGLGKLQLYNLFYTAIFNYSIYAFNYKDYYEERTLEDRWRKRKKGDKDQLMYDGQYNQDRNWLKGLFHKNDGYQTPIVLNPMRDNGIINVPKENELTSERLLNMLFYTNEHQIGHGKQPAFPFRTVNEHLEIVAIKVSQKEYPYFSRENLFDTLNFRSNSLTEQFSDVRQTLCTTWCKLFCMSYHEETEHEKLAWDYVVYKTLKIAKTYDKYNRLEQELIYFKKLNPVKIENLLSEMLLDETHITLKLRQTLCFLKFKVFREDYRKVISLYEAYDKYADIIKTFKSMDIKMDQQTGRLTMKVPEGYNEKDLPSFTVDPYTGHLVISFSDEIERPIPLFYLHKGELYAKTPDVREIMLPPIFDITLMLIEKNKVKKNGSYDEKDLIPMYGLSSGERQISGVVSNFAYHLVNINSVWNDANTTNLGAHPDAKAFKESEDAVIFKYKYVNAVFDEVELYFHPDLQRRFVRHLISTLKNLHLEHIEGVNIIMVTHSPFVLSDLPRTNVLAIGDDGRMVKETFCANIHEMLGNSFFMDYTVGDLAREQVEEIMGLYNKYLDSENKSELITKHAENWDRYRYVISLVADEYLHGLVNRMLDEMSRYLPDRYLNTEELDRKIEETEAQLRELKARKERGA